MMRHIEFVEFDPRIPVGVVRALELKEAAFHHGMRGDRRFRIAIREPLFVSDVPLEGAEATVRIRTADFALECRNGRRGAGVRVVPENLTEIQAYAEDLRRWDKEGY